MGRTYSFNIPNMPPELASQVEKTLNGAVKAGESINVENMDAFSCWLNRKNPLLYRKVKPYIDAIYEAAKKVLDVTHSFLWHLGKALCN